MATMQTSSVQPRRNGRSSVQRDQMRRSGGRQGRNEGALARGLELGPRYRAQLRIRGENDRLQELEWLGHGSRPSDD